MRRFLRAALVLILLAAPLTTRPQTASDAGQKNARQARVVLDAMVPLPKERGNAIRATAEFAAAGRRLYEALEQGESAAKGKP